MTGQRFVPGFIEEFNRVYAKFIPVFEKHAKPINIEVHAVPADTTPFNHWIERYLNNVLTSTPANFKKIREMHAISFGTRTKSSSSGSVISNEVTYHLAFTLLELMNKVLLTDREITAHTNEFLDPASNITDQFDAIYKYAIQFFHPELTGTTVPSNILQLANCDTNFQVTLIVLLENLKGKFDINDTITELTELLNSLRNEILPAIASIFGWLRNGTRYRPQFDQCPPVLTLGRLRNPNAVRIPMSITVNMIATIFVTSKPAFEISPLATTPTSARIRRALDGADDEPPH
jgi:hypothetical protein